MKKLASLRIVDSALLALVVAGAASSTVACSKEEPKKASWSCTSADVPQGSVVRCTQQAATSDGPPIDSASTETAGGAGTTGTTDGTSDGSGGFGDLSTDGTISFPIPTDVGTGSGSALEDGTTLYTCTSNSTNPDCPALDAEVGSGSGSATDGSGAATDGSSSTDGTSSGSSGTQDGVNDGSGSATPGECGYVPELPYCGGTSGEGTTDGSSSGSTTDCTKNNCDAPGQTKDGTNNGTSSGNGGGSSGNGGNSSGNGGGSSSGSSGASSGASGGGASSGSSGTTDGSSAGGNGKGKKAGGHEYTCKKDKKGNKACQSVPTCAKGSHPSSCGACVSDADGASECLPQSAGGCWVTGGGFVVAPNAVTGDAADGHDNFGGNAKPMKDGTIKGHWNHVDHGTGNHAKGRPEYIYCRHVDEPGPGGPGAKKGFTMNQVYFGGPAEWRDAATGAWGGGYWFDVVAKDHGEPGSVPKIKKNGGMPDTYHFTIRLVADPVNNASGTKIYETQGELQGGNVQLHPPNNGHPATQSTLPAWVSLEP